MESKILQSMAHMKERGPNSKNKQEPALAAKISVFIKSNKMLKEIKCTEIMSFVTRYLDT